MRILLPSLALVSAVVLSAAAHATTIGPNCGAGNCMGSVYTLTYSTTANPDVFNVTLQVDTTAYTGGASDTLNAVSLKLVSQSSDITSVVLTSAPSDFTTTQTGGINSGGCSGTGGGFFCSQSNDNGVATGAAGDVYNFTWQLTLAAPGDLSLTGDSVKASYLTAQGGNAGLTSADIALTQVTAATPEPSSLMLLGTGVFGAAGFVRRRIAK